MTTRRSADEPTCHEPCRIRAGPARQGRAVPHSPPVPSRHVRRARFAVDAYVNFARRASWQEAASSSLTELFAPQIHQSRLDSWPQHYPWIDGSGYDYFRKRLKEARRDVEHGLRITLEHYRTREAQERMLEILQFKLDVLWSMLDAMSMAYELQRPPYHTVTNERVWHRGIEL